MASTLLMLQIVSFLDFMSIGLIMPQLANHAKQLDFSYVQIGMMGALYSACQTISAPIIGSITDLRGTKPIFLLCLIICSLSYYLLGIVSSIYIFFLLRGILGLFKQIQLLIKAVITEYGRDANEQGILYGQLIAIAGFGMSMGPVISGHVVEAFPNYGFSILTSVVGTMFAVNTGLIYMIPINSKVKKEKSKDTAVPLLRSMGNTLKESVNEFYKVDWSKFWDIFLYKMLMALTMGLYFTNFAIFLTDEHGVSQKNLGYVVAFQGIVGSSSNFVIRYINKWYKNDTDYSQRTLHIFLITTVSLIGLASVPEVYMFIAILVPKSVCGSVGRVVMLEMTTSRSDPGQKGAIMGVSNSVKSMTGVITPIIGGIIAQYIGVRYAFYVAASVNLIGVAVNFIKRSQKIKEKTK